MDPYCKVLLVRYIIMIVTLRPLFSIVLVSKVNFDKFRRMEGVDPGHPCGGDRALLRGLIHGLDG